MAFQRYPRRPSIGEPPPPPSSVACGSDRRGRPRASEWSHLTQDPCVAADSGWSQFIRRLFGEWWPRSELPTDREPAMTSSAPHIPEALTSPSINRGTAFDAEQRRALGLTGRLPSAVLTLEDQAQRLWQQLQSLPSGPARKPALSVR